MSELAVVVLPVDGLPLAIQPKQEAVYVPYRPELPEAWPETIRQVQASGASQVLLQYSHESVDIPAHGWRYVDWRCKRYRRLYAAETFAAFPSLWSCLELQPELLQPLPGWKADRRERDAAASDEAHLIVRLLHAFDQELWDEAERLLQERAGSLPEADALFAAACLYDRTNRSEEAYAAGKRALSSEPEPGRPPACDPSQLWLAHGLHASRIGKREQAAAAYCIADAERAEVEPLVCWLDDMIREGEPEEAAIAAVADWLATDPEPGFRLALTLHRAGLFERALEAAETAAVSEEAAPLPAGTGSDGLLLSPDCNCRSSLLLARIRFDGLAYAGRLADAMLLTMEQPDAYRSRFPADDALCRLLLADGEAGALAGAMSGEELAAAIGRAFDLRLFELAERLQPYAATAAGAEAEPLAAHYFRRGYVLRSASLDLASLREGGLDPAGFRRLGTTLYYRGAYEEAAGMFEYVLAHSPGDASLRTALALACLRQSESLLGESMHIFPSSLFLREEADKVHAGIKTLESSGALPRWRRAERRNFDA
ncbi:MAG: hypothetical protein J7639_13065 [Paenibacillaceae bacterium]|nr:hypothetical protein [Paenibacillaceae bacterium]